jgi:hypothetical protein
MTMVYQFILLRHLPFSLLLAFKINNVRLLTFFIITDIMAKAAFAIRKREAANYETSPTSCCHDHTDAHNGCAI